MADENEVPSTDATEESAAPGRTIENVQSEFNRKMTKLAEENSKLSQQLGELTGLVQQVVQPRQQPQANSSQSEDADLEDLAYKDPKAYARKVREQARNEAAQLVDARLNQNNANNAVLSQLGSEYPELNDANSDLTLKAVEIYKRMSAAEKSSPLGYKAAVRDAAADLGILPKNKRKQTSSEVPEFSASSSSSQAAGSQQSKSKNLDTKTLAFAKLIGLNTDDKKVVDRLKSRAQRTKWNKYE